VSVKSARRSLADRFLGVSMVQMCKGTTTQSAYPGKMLTMTMIQMLLRASYRVRF
jgi:hypothetical protein